jgi:hypothetical protein
MKTLLVITGIVTCLSFLSTMICGLWIKANNVTEASSLSFHTNIGILSVVVGCAFVVLAIFMVFKG